MQSVTFNSFNNKILRKFSSEKKKENGVIYTPSNLANYVAYKLISYYMGDTNTSESRIISNLKIIDPACGEGELLYAVWNKLTSRLNNSILNPFSSLCGIDLDENSIEMSKHKIAELAATENKVKYNFVTTNALLPRDNNLNIQSWSDLKYFFGAESGFDLLIANPPWGANTSSYIHMLEKNFVLNKGQFDSADLFVELAINIVKKGGYFAFILPDSLFGYEHKQLRGLLLEKTEIKYIGRLGEKLFGGVNRACVVIVCKNIKPDDTNQVQCMRLTPELRNQILDNKISFLDAEKTLIHNLPQHRFTINPDLLFDIDSKDEELNLIDRISATKEIVTNYLDSSRGVELSKSGLVYNCDTCGLWSPLPAKIESKCKHCGQFVERNKLQPIKIINKEKFEAASPILVGESLRRYSITSKYWISLNSKGINYKNPRLYYEPKILVRKTGIGITATIDYSNSLTNQVVYIFKPKKNIFYNPPLEFILAVMNSRVIFYYLLKKYGESEWRTHPYLTQSQILKLPLPDITKDKSKKFQKVISSLLAPFLKTNTKVSIEVDAKIEFLISQLYGLSIDDYRIIYKALNSSQSLIPVKELCSVDINDIFRK